MRRLLVGLFLYFAAINFLEAESQNFPLVDDPGLAYSNVYPIDTQKLDYSRWSAQVTYSTADFKAVTFLDGRQSTATITISSFTAISSAPATATLLVSSNSALAGNYATNSVSISSNGFLGVSTNTFYLTLNGSTITLNKDFVATSFSTQTAYNIATAFNNLNVYAITASTTGTGSTVTLTAGIVGSAYNSFTMTSSSPTAIPVTFPTFRNGTDPIAINLNGYQFFAPRSLTVDVNFATKTAANIANTLNFSTYNITATTGSINTSTGCAIILTALQYGVIGNAYTITTTSNALTPGATNFRNGRNPATFFMNNTSLVCGIGFSNVRTASDTAKSLSDALMTYPALSSVVSTTWTTGGVIFATSTAINPSTFTVFSSTQGAIQISSVAFTYSDGSALGYFQNGADTNISTQTNVISTSNFFTTGLPVILNRNAGSTPGGLANQVTYYVTTPSPINFKLSYTATGAVAGVPVVIATQNVGGGGSFTLTPLPFRGSTSFKWQISNDSVTWGDMNVSSISITTNTLPYSTTTYDFGNVNYRWLRVIFSTSTAGATQLKIYMNGKK